MRVVAPLHAWALKGTPTQDMHHAAHDAADDATLHEALRELTRRHGSLLIVDETHTLSSGLGGYTRSHGLAPDFLVCGKAIAGGVPCAVYGMSAALAQRAMQAKRLTQGSREELAFEAFGKRFDLHLEPNPQLAAAVPAGRADLVAL